MQTGGEAKVSMWLKRRSEYGSEGVARCWCSGLEDPFGSLHTTTTLTLHDVFKGRTRDDTQQGGWVGYFRGGL